MAVVLASNIQNNLVTEDIRMFLRDTPDYNILLDTVEFSNEDIARAIKLTVYKWNAIPPVSMIEDPAVLNGYVLLCGTCGFLLKSEGLRQARNQMQTQDGNIAPVGLDEKEAIYMKWAQHFQEEFALYAQRIKIQQNMESIMGGGLDISNGFGSGYAYCARWFR